MVDLRDGEEHLVQADALVLATTNESQRWLADELAGDALEVHSIGDAIAPRLAIMAIYEGRALALKL